MFGSQSREALRDPLFEGAIGGGYRVSGKHL
jgi:hypothetical protein